MKRYVMGIDQGTTGTRAIIFEKESNIIASAYREITQFYPQLGWVEHDALEIWDITLKVSKEALKKANLLPSDLAAIGITNQRETTTFWSKNTGQPVGRSIVWQDRRSLPIVEDLIARDGEGIINRTGMVLIPNIAVSKIKWLLDNDVRIRDGVDKGELIYGTIDTWLIWKLSGGTAHVSDYSNTSVTTLLNARTLDYDKGILDVLQIPRSILPELRSSSEIYAYTDPSIFGASVPIAGDAGDQQAAVLGQACTKAGMAKNTYGTGSFMLVNTGEKYVPPIPGIFSPVLWKMNANVSYALEGMADVSGAAIQWMRDGLGIIQKYNQAQQLATTVSDNGGVYFIPAFVGLGSPYFDSYARGSIFGITRGSNKAHIARAALESMAYQVGDALTMMEKASGNKLNVLRVDGGGANNDFLMQFQADILGIPVERPKITETTCLGAAYLAGLAVGYWDSLDDVSRNWQLERCFEPKMSQDQRETLYAGWKKAVERSSGWLKE